MEGLTEPVAARTRALLRRAVHALAASGGRRPHPPALHIGRPGGPTVSMALDDIEPSDPGLRTDVVAAMCSRAGPGGEDLVWLTRGGDLELQDVDARWLAAARAAYAEVVAPLVFVVVTRHGWRDPRSGVETTWARVRP